jgi:hypothetical protein|tara:strand:+ start:1706 stop:1969 length:264 start_codon:yes stop_codon:yes gene_type:complete
MAVQLEYDKIMKRYNVLLPFTLEDESSDLVVAAISEDERLTLHRELSLNVVQQILLKWDERVHMDTVNDKKQSGEFDELFNNNNKGE